MKPLINTPIEYHDCGGHQVFVKREDRAVSPPAPPFSKVRGLWSHLLRLREEGVSVIGYTETSISMAGWGVAWAAKELGLRAVLFDPQYKETPPLLTFHRKQWAQFSPEILPVPAGMARVNFNICKNTLRQRYGEKAVMLELGLPFEETVEETAQEWRRTMDSLNVKPNSVVVNVGSGTVCAGILRGWRDYEGVVYGVMGRTGDKSRKRKAIFKKSRTPFGGLLGVPFHLFDPGWEYTEKAPGSAPFPCHPFYDLKAWRWMEKRIEEIQPPVLFWNIGRMA